MKSILKLHIESGDFHHGYLLAGDFEESRNMAKEAAEKLLGYAIAKLNSHPDFYHRDFELFGVKESNEIKEKAATRPFLGDKKVIIIETFSFNKESANALLKIFEEPPQGMHFFVIVPSVDVVIPTLRSRLTVVSTNKDLSSSSNNGVSFLANLPSERMKVISKFFKNKEGAMEFLDELEVALAEPTPGVGSLTDARGRLSAFEQIQKSREILSTRSPSVKMILEHLALVLPQV